MSQSLPLGSIIDLAKAIYCINVPSAEADGKETDQIFCKANAASLPLAEANGPSEKQMAPAKPIKIQAEAIFIFIIPSA